MAGWENNNEEPRVEQVELLVDTNPDLYKQRTIAALSEKRYRDAMNEAQTALKYGNNALEYHVLMARVLFEWGEYPVCMQYITRHLWEKKEDSSLLSEEQSYIYYAYAACYRECGYPLNDTDVIIVTYDGKGMCATLQQAIEMRSNHQTIILVDGYYENSASNVPTFHHGNTDFQVGDLKIVAQNISIKGTGSVSISGQFTAEKSDINIDRVVFHLSNKVSDEDGFIIHDSNIKMYKVNSCDTSIGVTGTSKVSADDCSLGKSIEVSGGEVRINNCRFQGKGILVLSTTALRSKIYVENTEFRLSPDGIGVSVAQNGYAEVWNCDIYEGNTGISVLVDESIENSDIGGECHVYNCKIHQCSCNVALVIRGSIRMESCDILGARRFGIVLAGNVRLDLINSNLKDNMKDIENKGAYTGVRGIPVINETGVKRLNNDGLGFTLHTAKRIAEGIFGRKLF